MSNEVLSNIKAQGIAAAIYTATNVQPDVIFRPGRNPLITFSRENTPKISAFLETQLKKKSDVDIDFFPFVAPVVLKKILPAALAIAGTLIFIGYAAGRK